MEPAKRRLANGYSRSAPVYDATAGQLYRNGFNRLLPYLRVPPHGAVLDVGSGTGINLFEAARAFAPTRMLCGIDLSPGMVEVARLKAARLGVPAHFTVGDAESLPYPNGTFDLVICNSVLHWFRDRNAALREMSRVLRPGGQVALICAAAPGFGEWTTLMQALVQAVTKNPAASPLPALPTAQEVAEIMQRNGLTLQHLANPVHAERISNPEPYIRLMSIVAPQWAADLTPEQQSAIERLAATLMRTWWPTGFPNTWSAIEAIGVKTALL